MNFGRLALAAVAATVFDVVYGFLVYGTWLSSEFLRHAAVYGVAAALVQAAGFLLLPMYLRCLGPADYGVLEVVTRFAETFESTLQTQP